MQSMKEEFTRCRGSDGLGRNVRLCASANALKTVDHNSGLDAAR